MSYTIASLQQLIQPLIENYIIHGYDLKKESNHIHINGHLVDDNIVITIEDNGLGINEDKLELLKKELIEYDIRSNSSIGLRNVNERIKLIYGRLYGISLDSTVGVGTIVTITVSARTKEELLLCIK